MYNACIFDLDGTLIDSLEDLALSVNYALSDRGYPTHETELYRYFVGNGAAKLIERTLPEGERTPENLSATRAVYDAYYKEHCFDHTKPYPGIPELLAELREKGVRLAVVSNKPDDFVRKMVQVLFKDTFDVVLGQREGVPRKPDPAGAFEACEGLRTTPSGCVYLGDSGVDMQTARAAGMSAVGVLWGFRDREELLENGAERLIASPGELLEIFRESF